MHEHWTIDSTDALLCTPYELSHSADECSSHSMLILLRTVQPSPTSRTFLAYTYVIMGNDVEKMMQR